MRSASWWTGFLAGAILALGAAHLLRKGVQPDYYGDAFLESAITLTSFSEAQNTQATLNALAEQFVLNVRADQARQILSEGASSPAPRARALRALLAGRAEFRGSSAEAIVTRDLLQLLRATGHRAEWLGVYLEFVYSHPSSDLVGDFADEACRLALSGFRAKEIRQAFEFVRMLPAGSSGKQTVLDAHERLAALSADPTIAGGANVQPVSL